MKFKIVGFTVITLIFLSFSVSSCGVSIPNLEPTECIESRNTVKEFYSFHFGNEMKPSVENLQRREKFLSPELINQLSRINSETIDYFTQTENYPKAFSVGACEVISPEKTNFNILLFWKDGARSEQRPLRVEVTKSDKDWLINKVENK